MEKFNICTVLDRYQPDTDVLAKLLFPGAKYPKQAFARVVKGEAELDAQQLVILASHLGILVQDLFAETAWSSFNEDGCICFKRGPYKAKLNYKGVYLTLYKGDEVIGQYIGNIPNMTVEFFIAYIDELIKAYEEHN